MTKNNALLINNKNGHEFYFLPKNGYLSDQEMGKLKDKVNSISVIDMEDEESFKPYQKDFIMFYRDNCFYLDDGTSGFKLHEILNIKRNNLSEEKIVNFLIEYNEKIVYIVNQNGYLFNLIHNDDENVDFKLLEKEGCFVFNDENAAIKKVAEMLQEPEEEVMNGESICFRKLNDVWVEYNERYTEDHHDEDFEQKQVADKIINYMI